jgi:hypothetical protein
MEKVPGLLVAAHVNQLTVGSHMEPLENKTWRQQERERQVVSTNTRFSHPGEMGIDFVKLPKRTETVATNLTYQIHLWAYVQATPGYLKPPSRLRYEIVAYEWTWKVCEKMLFISVSNNEEVQPM